MFVNHEHDSYCTHDTLARAICDETVFRIEDAYIFEKKKLDVELLDESSSTSLLFKEAQITVTIDDKHVAIKYIDSTNKLVESKFNADVEYVDDFIENISMLLKQLHFFLTHRNNYK